MFATYKALLGSSGLSSIYGDIIGSYDVPANPSLRMNGVTEGGCTGWDTQKFAVSCWAKVDSTSANVLWDVDIPSQNFQASRSSGGTLVFNIPFTSHTCSVNTADGSLTMPQYPFRGAGNVDKWRHIFLVIDTTQAVQADRIKVYVNGSLLTLTLASGSLPALNDTIYWSTVTNNASSLAIGGTGTNGGGWVGHFAQMAWFSGTLPTISQVYSAGPKNLGALAGRVLYAIGRSGTANALPDEIIVTDWDNTAMSAQQVSLSVDVPYVGMPD